MPAHPLLTASRAALRAALEAGHAVPAEALAGFEYHGVSLGLPGWVERLTWKTFVKAFHRDPDSGAVRGWNVRMEQTGLDGPLVARERGGLPWTFGYFRVLPEGERLLLDYGGAGNPWYDLTALVRDPLVAVEAGSAELLLGRSDVALGPARLPTPSYFLLRRARPLTHVATPGAPTRLLG